MVRKSDIAEAIEASLQLALVKADLPRLSPSEYLAAKSLETVALMLGVEEAAQRLASILSADQHAGRGPKRQFASL